MSVGQGEGKVVYSDVCLRYRVREKFCTVMWSEVQCEGNIVYSDVCLKYRVREKLCTVMCF